MVMTHLFANKMFNINGLKLKFYSYGILKIIANFVANDDRGKHFVSHET